VKRLNLPSTPPNGVCKSLWKRSDCWRSSSRSETRGRDFGCDGRPDPPPHSGSDESGAPEMAIAWLVRLQVEDY
jgi:hypothetical protein